MLPENYKDIFDFYGEGVIIERSGEIIYANSSAKKMIPPAFFTHGINYIFPGIPKDFEEGRFSSDTYIDEKHYYFTAVSTGEHRIFTLFPEIGISDNDTQLLSSVLNELRSDLSLMEMSLNAMSLHKKKDEDSIEKYTPYLMRSMYLMQRLTDNLNYTMQISSGRLEKHLSSFDFVKALGDIVDTANHFFTPEGVEIVFHCEETYIPFTGDRDKLEYLVYNLLSNAVKYSPPGNKIQLFLTKTDSGVIVRLSDSGEGLSSESLRWAFRKYLSDKNLSDPKAGAGLGLHIVNGIARLHGGTAILDSRQGSGTTVTVRLNSDTNSKLSDEITPYAPSEFKAMQEAMADVLPYDAYTKKYSD